MEEFLQWLAAEHGAIIGCEQLGIKLLNSGDSEGYKTLLLAKTQLLANIAKAAQPHMSGLSQAMQEKTANALQKFADSAAMALQLHSTFYMSALLYRDDHKQGEPDNLEVYIKSLRENFSGGRHD